MKTLIIGASTSSSSINKKLATHAATLILEAESTVLDLNHYEMPIYSVDKENTGGIPDLAKEFVNQVESHDAIILSLAEHNGSYTAAFKNILDWASRAKQNFWSKKPMLLLATSPGARGGSTVLSSAESYFPHMGAEIKATFSLPSFTENFGANGITDSALAQQLQNAVNKLST